VAAEFVQIFGDESFRIIHFERVRRSAVRGPNNGKGNFK
jgi:hypothetical protein